MAFFQNEYTDGIYVNLSRVDFTSFDMSFQLPSGVSLEDIDENIYLHVSSLNEDVYRYEVSKSKRLASLKSGSSDPVMSYTNIDNGLTDYRFLIIFRRLLEKFKAWNRNNSRWSTFDL